MHGVCVGCGDNMGDSVGDGHLGHGAGNFEGLSAVVDAWKYVTVNVDHPLEREYRRRAADDNESTDARFSARRESGRKRPERSARRHTASQVFRSATGALAS